MPMMQTSTLLGPPLDWAIAMSEGIADILSEALGNKGWYRQAGQLITVDTNYQPSTDPRQAIDIMEKLRIATYWSDAHEQWAGNHEGHIGYGPTLLIAAMRARALSAHGSQVMIPNHVFNYRLSQPWDQ